MNTELFKKIDDTIQAQPGSFDMSGWESTACGTTRCMAGWAIHYTTGRPLRRAPGRTHPSVIRLAAELDVVAEFEEVGAKLLGLSEEESSTAFYMDDRFARRFIHLAAQGLHAEAREVLAEWENE